jgi:hypothetical protein
VITSRCPESPFVLQVHVPARSDEYRDAWRYATERRDLPKGRCQPTVDGQTSSLGVDRQPGGWDVEGEGGYGPELEGQAEEHEGQVEGDDGQVADAGIAQCSSSGRARLGLGSAAGSEAGVEDVGASGYADERGVVLLPWDTPDKYQIHASRRSTRRWPCGRWT